MDVIEASITVAFLVVGALGGIAAVLHMRGWLPKAYISRLRNVQVELASLVGVEVENALNRVASAQEAKYTEAAKAAETSLKMSGVRQVGIDKAQLSELKGLMVEGIGGPVFKAIEMWNPDWADKLREVDPDLLMRFLDSPWFQNNILPRIQPFLSKFLGQTATGSVDASGWGT